MTWLDGTYMARKGVARGKAGETHMLDAKVQGRYHYVYGPYAEPVLTIVPGDIVVAETEDAFGGAIKTVDDLPSQKLNMPFVNPQCGPIAVEGAEKGDVLCVHIHSIKPRGPQPVGTIALIEEPLLTRELPREHPAYRSLGHLLAGHHAFDVPFLYIFAVDQQTGHLLDSLGFIGSLGLQLNVTTF